MAHNSLTDFTPVIKQQIISQEALLECLTKVEAIAHMALSDDFLDYPKPKIHAYLWALSDRITEIKNINENAYNKLMSNTKF